MDVAFKFKVVCLYGTVGEVDAEEAGVLFAVVKETSFIVRSLGDSEDGYKTCELSAMPKSL